MQKRSDSSFFVELVLGGKSKRVDPAKFVIWRIGHCAFDGGGAAGIGRLPQNTKQGFRLAHLSLLRRYVGYVSVVSYPDKAFVLANKRPTLRSQRVFDEIVTRW